MNLKANTLGKQRIMFKKFPIVSSFIQQTFIERQLCAGTYGMPWEYKIYKDSTPALKRR